MEHKRFGDELGSCLVDLFLYKFVTLQGWVRSLAYRAYTPQYSMSIRNYSNSAGFLTNTKRIYNDTRMTVLIIRCKLHQCGQIPHSFRGIWKICRIRIRPTDPSPSTHTNITLLQITLHVRLHSCRCTLTVILRRKISHFTQFYVNMGKFQARIGNHGHKFLKSSTILSWVLESAQNFGDLSIWISSP